MKDLIHSFFALILGFILGVLTLIVSLIGVGLWAYAESGKKKPAPKPVPETSSTY